MKPTPQMPKPPFCIYIANGFVSSKIYDKRDGFDFDTVNFPILDGDVPRRADMKKYGSTTFFS